MRADFCSTRYYCKSFEESIPISLRLAVFSAGTPLSSLDKKMIGPIVSVFSSRCYRPRIIFRALVSLSRLWYRIKGKELVFDSKRFEEAAWVSKCHENKSGNHSKSIEVVIVSTSKDFDILPYSINYASRALRPYTMTGARVIVPNRDVAACKRLIVDLKCQVEIIDENDLISQSHFKKLTEVFGGRNTWVLQQLLKVQAVLTSKSDAVLIIDSDTVLLRPRPWFSPAGHQILMPSMEYNESYYQFLNKLQISELVPKYSFISHHMLMQPKILSNILDSLDLLEIDSFITYICRNANTNVQSPICIEYELYGQYLFNAEPTGYFLERWSNISISRKHSSVILKSKFAKFILKTFYNSVSFHSWS